VESLPFSLPNEDATYIHLLNNAIALDSNKTARVPAKKSLVRFGLVKQHRAYDSQNQYLYSRRCHTPRELRGRSNNECPYYRNEAQFACLRSAYLNKGAQFNAEPERRALSWEKDGKRNGYRAHHFADQAGST
jgi:hypothetical protein